MNAVILLPNFRLQAVLRFREELGAGPVAVTDETDTKGQVLEVNEAAARAGVAPGLTSPQAMARCTKLRLLPRSPAQEAATQAVLLEMAGTLSPEVEATAPGYVTVDLRGARKTDWMAMGARVVEEVAALRLTARVGVGGNPDLAFLAARHARPVLVVQTPAAFLANLAIHELEPSPEMLAVLREWGVHNLGQLTSLPRGELMDRLGPEAARLWERAAGRTGRPLRLVRPVEEFGEAFDFEHEVDSAEPLLFLLRRFLDDLTVRLARVYRVAGRMFLRLKLANGQNHERVFTVPSPTARVEVLFRILHTHLEGLRLEHCAVGMNLRIEATLAERQQFQLFESPLRDPNRLGETLGRLAALAGPENVGVPVVLDTHQPDRFRLETPRFQDLGRSALPPEDLAIGLPLRRFRPPIPATVRMVRNAPAHVGSARANGAVVQALGPYRISGTWWETAAWAVEEWDVELETGGIYRIVRKGKEWEVEGAYDEPMDRVKAAGRIIAMPGVKGGEG